MKFQRIKFIITLLALIVITGCSKKENTPPETIANTDKNVLKPLVALFQEIKIIIFRR